MLKKQCTLTSHSSFTRLCAARFPRLVKAATVLLALSVLGSAQSVLAADAKGRFNVKGAGLATCERFLNGYKKADKEFYLFAGYVHGYLSAANALSASTYDLLPWQSDGALMGAVAGACKINPKERFGNVLIQLVRSLGRQRLTEYSDAVEVSKTPPQRLYREIIFRMQTQLKAYGHYDAEPTSLFDDKTETALRAFQAANALEQSGKPDQRTLIALFKPK
jgi:hypothetical protein